VNSRLIPTASHRVHYTPISVAGWRTGMVINTATIFAIAAVCLAAIAVGPAAHAQAQRHTVTVKHAPIANPGDVSNSRSAQQNVVESGCGAVVLGRPCRLPPLSSGGALVGRP
jgi:hypothetical protein